ncbi:hypothetical protein CHS0354_006583 [Potamilus streckersoni]|uniref:Mab-21-like HhH/H2TH-like domain-containing protein n=1 Tax=Potamilus streckersoni TaxID=2493646 RepID=A0AAE0W3T3_9BIVA|nr:hypothetical protein CHS0354_006583 [Potamilus streckersoni]
MKMTLNIPEYYQEVSLRLNRVLDTVGLEESIRWQKMNIWIQTQKMTSVTYHGDRMFGSQAEATTTPGLQSDVDIILPLPATVIQNLESWVPEVQNLLVVSDENTPPGYIKLQGVEIDLPLLMFNATSKNLKVDRYGRSVVCHDNDLFKGLYDGMRHGPAFTASFCEILTVDIVPAMRLHTWPYHATEWITRNRSNNWPSQIAIDLIQQTGALLVPVGHKHSPEKHLEWRISISFAEKLLVWQFNSTQYKCYILLKIINKSFIKPILGNDVLSSYHCKTCIFYLLESTPTAMWQPENLLLCLELCLRLLYIWTEAATCPNYFIPEENMFQCKVYGHVQGWLLCVLRNLLSQEGRYLARISCDNIGDKLVRTCQYPRMELEIENYDVGTVMWISVWCQLYAVNNLICEPRTLDRLLFSQEVVLEITDVLWKYYCSIIGSKLASKSLSREFHDQQGLEMAQELLLWGSSSDAASGKLKLAAFYLVLDNLDLAEDVLNEIHANYTYKILCGCNMSRDDLVAKLNENRTISNIISHHTAYPVIYELSEIKCIPKALIPEMFRATGSEPDSGYERYTKSLASIDAKVYLHFLEFICYFRQNKTTHKNVALYNMINTIEHVGLHFKDTALNLLAYCLRQEGKLINAFNILCKSLMLTKKQNAAKWQIATLINAAYIFLHAGK